MRLIQSMVFVFAVLGCGRYGFEGGLDDDERQRETNVVFVTSSTHAPTEFGTDLAGADSICTARARDAGLAGRYVAWLSNATTIGRDRLGGARGWSRVDGKPVVDRIDDLVAGRLFHPIRIDEYGYDIGTAGALVATATNPDGDRSSRRCGDYADAASYIRVGAPWCTTDEWTNDGDDQHDCTSTQRLYCFGVDHAVPVEPVPVTDRLAFMTVRPFTSGGGLAAADVHCANEAMAGGLTGEYLALLGTSFASASSRFDLSPDRPWARVDGVLLANTPLEFMAGMLDAPLAVDQLHEPRAANVLTGGDPLERVPSMSSCLDWTNSMPTMLTRSGRSVATGDAHFESGDYRPCDVALPLYCLER